MALQLCRSPFHPSGPATGTRAAGLAWRWSSVTPYLSNAGGAQARAPGSCRPSWSRCGAAGFPTFSRKTFSYESDRRFQPLGTRGAYYLLVSWSPPAGCPAGPRSGCRRRAPFSPRAERWAAKGALLASPLFELAEGRRRLHHVPPVGRGAMRRRRPVRRGKSCPAGDSGRHLEPPLEIRDPRIAYGCATAVIAETAFGDSLFSFPHACLAARTLPFPNCGWSATTATWTCPSSSS